LSIYNNCKKSRKSRYGQSKKKKDTQVPFDASKFHDGAGAKGGCDTAGKVVAESGKSY
jgi:hypothetical protein